MNYTEIEGKVREATNDDPWGPTGPLMQELAHATFTYEHFPEVMSMLWRRMLQDNKTNWRRTYKVSASLPRQLLHYLSLANEFLIKSFYTLSPGNTCTQLSGEKRERACRDVGARAHLRPSVTRELHIRRRERQGSGRQCEAQSA